MESVAMTELDREALHLLRLALDTEPTAREALIAQHTDAPELVARVRELLARVDEDEVRAVAEPVDDAGLMIGPYRVLRRIGRGGMGEVFLAERADGAWQREVALKRIWGGFSPLTDRFLRERQVLARLQHPHIAQLLDGGVSAQGQPWFAMEHVRGEAITRWCDARQADLETRVALLCQVCEAVQFAHAHLVVHRDIKPANVLVGDDSQAKLLDFGIAKLLDDVDPAQTQTLAMTPAWASPEQVRGDPVGTASDVYQLGLLLHALLIGAPPDRIATGGQQVAPVRIAATWAALQRADADTAATIAAARGLTPARLGARLRHDLDAIVDCATANDPRERYKTAEALREDLQRWLSHLPVQARQGRAGYRVRKFVQRNPAATALSAMLALVVAGAGVFGWQRLQAERAQFRRAESTVAFMRDIFVGTTPDKTNGASVTAEQLLDRASGRLQDKSDLDAISRAYLDGELGNTYVELGRYEKAETHLRRAVDALRPVRDTHADAYLEWLADLAFAITSNGRQRQTLDLLAGNAEFIEEHLTVPSRQRGRLVLQRGDALLELGRIDEAERDFRAAVADLRTQAPGEPLLNAQVSLGRLLSDRNQFRDALALFEQARRDSIRVRGLSEGARDGMEYYRALALAHLGRYREASTIYEAVLPRWIQREGEQHPYTDVIRIALARAYSAEGRYTDARALMARLRRTLDAQGVDPARIAAADSSDARIALDSLRAAEALPYAQRAVAFFERANPQPTPRRGRARNLLGEALLQAHDCAGAEPMLRSGLADITHAYGTAPHVEHARALDGLGRCRLLRGDYRGAQRQFEAARRQLDALYGPDDRRTLRSHVHLLWAQALADGQSERVAALRPRLVAAYGSDQHPVIGRFDRLTARIESGTSLPPMLSEDIEAGRVLPHDALGTSAQKLPVGLLGGD